MILEDEERMEKFQNGGKLRTGYHTKSIIDDLGNTGKSIKFSEESSRTIHEFGNFEFHELGQISRTVQCQSCWKHVPEGLISCSCGICLRSDEEQIPRIKARFEAMVVHHHLARVNHSRGKRHGEDEGKETIGKQWVPEEDQEGKVTTPV